MDRYIEDITPTLMSRPTIAAIPSGDLKSSGPIMVTPFVRLVFLIFISLYNIKSNNSPTKATPIKPFTGKDPYKYEEYIKGLLRSHGFATRKTRSSGDFGVDVLANKNGKTFAIQCKLYNRPVGTKVIQEIVTGRVFYKTDYAVVVSDNKFTDAAKTLARRSNVILVHHSKIVQKLNSIAGTGTPKSVDVINPIKYNSNTKRESGESPIPNQWTKDDVDTLITTVILTITNDK